MRQYNHKDYDYIYKSLLNEGFKKNQMTFDTDLTYLTDTGFFSYRIENEYPRLVHFYINKEKRSIKSAQDLIRKFRELIIKEGYLFFIAQAPKELPHIKRIIKYIKGVKYLNQDGDTYYYVPVFGRIT